MTDAQTQTPPADTQTPPAAQQTRPAPTPAAPAAQQTPPAAQQTPPAAGQPYRPQGMAEDMLGKSDAETIDRLYERFSGLRAKLAERGAAPETPDGYAFAFEGELAPYAAQLDADPVFADIKAKFHAAGVTDKQAQGIVGGILKTMIDSGQIEAPLDPLAEAKALYPDIADETQLKAAVNRQVGDNIAFLKALQNAGLSPRAIEAATGLQDRAGGVELVKFMMGLGQGGPLTDGAAPKGTSEADLDRRYADPRNDPRSPKFDRAFAVETQRLTQALYPG